MKVIIAAIICIAVGFFVLFGGESKSINLSTNEDVSTHLKSVQPTQSSGYIKLYTTSSCKYCKKTKAFFDRKGVRYKEYDVEKSLAANRRFKELKGRGVPLIEADGKVIRGYNVQLLESLIADGRYNKK